MLWLLIRMQLHLWRYDLAILLLIQRKCRWSYSWEIHHYHMLWCCWRFLLLSISIRLLLLLNKVLWTWLLEVLHGRHRWTISMLHLRRSHFVCLHIIIGLLILHHLFMWLLKHSLIATTLISLRLGNRLHGLLLLNHFQHLIFSNDFLQKCFQLLFLLTLTVKFMNDWLQCCLNISLAMLTEPRN